PLEPDPGQGRDRTRRPRRAVAPMQWVPAPDEGSSSLTTVILTPIFLVIALMAFQAALWTHARTEARAIARDTAALVARSGGDPDDAAAAATRVLVADTDLERPSVVVDTDGRIVVV